VRPYSHSAADTQAKYRSADELADEALRDPIVTMERALVERGVITSAQAAELRAQAKEIVAKAAAEALAAARPDPGRVTEQVYVLPSLPDPPATYDGGDPVPLGEAVKRTLHELMAADERIRVFGEDVADAREVVLSNVEGKGGVFGTTSGLQRAFGQARCYNTPLSEANIVGRAVGQAIRGLRPAPEIQFFDYIWPAMTQIKSEAATIRWRSDGAFTCPTVIRVPIGGYLTGGAIWHSQCGESIFAHVPGLLIAARPRPDAAGLLRSPSSEDPVMFREHKHLLRQPYTVDAFASADGVIPFGAATSAARRRLTIVSVGATVEKSLQAAAGGGRRLGGGVDLRTISPWPDRARERGPHPPAAGGARGRVTAGFGAENGGVGGRALLTELTPVRRWRRSTPSGLRARWRTPSCRRSTTSTPPRRPLHVLDQRRSQPSPPSPALFCLGEKWGRISPHGVSEMAGNVEWFVDFPPYHGRRVRPSGASRPPAAPPGHAGGRARLRHRQFTPTPPRC
jgi:2-oxoisovalerate dehydrogenase E1 component